MNDRYLFLSLAVTLLMSSEANAQQATSETKKIAGVVVVDGPYELVGGGTGVLGYVLTRSGNKANFQPCAGKVELVDDSDLRRTQLDCKDEPPKDPNPINVACTDIESQVAIVTAMVGDVKTVDLGTAFLKSGSGYTQAMTPPSKDAWVQWDAVSAPPYAVCGQKYVVLPAFGVDEAWIGVIKTQSK